LVIILVLLIKMLQEVRLSTQQWSL